MDKMVLKQAALLIDLFFVFSKIQFNEYCARLYSSSFQLTFRSVAIFDKPLTRTVQLSKYFEFSHILAVVQHHFGLTNQERLSAILLSDLTHGCFHSNRVRVITSRNLRPRKGSDKHAVIRKMYINVCCSVVY